MTAGWGGSPWGGAPWGAGSAGSLQLLSALAIAENLVQLKFNQAPLFTGILDPHDAANPERYEILAVSGIGLDGEAVREVSPILAEFALVELAAGTVVNVFVDRAFSPYPCIYRISVNNLVSIDGDPLLAGSSLTFLGVQRGVPPPIVEDASGSKDFANPQTGMALFDPIPGAAELDSLVLGTYPTDSLGDYASDVGIVSYKKRVLRRLTTRKGKFAALPKYGVGLPEQVGKLSRPSAREALASDAEEQIREEPETQEVRVFVIANGPVARFVVKARTNFGQVNMEVPLAFSPTGT